ncbi:SPFH domain-containing protein [Streptomyces sp. NBC_00059]|uniref:SPFH domain-containing protein n=1 Tax=Streptomyces sp. NBC_00059 TaxID=2975635 RepID=UPI002251624E|nr:SPFH domain-containing protein [Streptomyces sp. NBC_00059]MCX5412374.1 SPFH domain-containing protein [Streptomyces sp. NBC_00059]
MRSTENVRGEWDELGERDTRVVVPGPGPGAGPGPELGSGPGDVPGALPMTERAEGGAPDAARDPDLVRDPDLAPGPGPERASDLVPGPGAVPAGEWSPERGPDSVPDRDFVPDPGLVPAPGREPGGSGAPGGEVSLAAEPLAVGPLSAGVPAAEARAFESCEVEAAAEPHEVGPARAEPLQPERAEPLAARSLLEEPFEESFQPEPLPEELLTAEPLPAEPFSVEPFPVGPLPAEPLAADAEDIPADLGPALDAVAEVGRPGPHIGVFPQMEPDPDPEPDPVLDTMVLPEGLGAGPGAPADLRKPFPAHERAQVSIGVGAADPVAWWGAGRRQPVITTETTAPIPVHLLFRDDGTGGAPADPAAGAAVLTRRPGARRPPLPRSPQAQASTRPAPLADPRLAERPGPVLPGWAALLTAAAGTAAGLAVLGWQGALPTAVTSRLGLGERAYDGVGLGVWALLALLMTVVLLALCGLGRGRVGHTSVLTLFGGYRGSVRRTGLLWISPLLLRRRIDVRLRHWRSDSLPAMDANGTALRAVVLVVWRVKDTARAALGVADHERYLSDQVEAALARVLSQLPADAFHEDTRTLRDAEAVGNALTRMLKADCAPVGIEVYSAQPTGIEYAPEVAAAMQRCRVAALDAKHRDGVLTSVVDAVDDTVGRLTARGIVELDAYEHKALVRDLTVAFYTGRNGGEGA